MSDYDAGEEILVIFRSLNERAKITIRVKIGCFKIMKNYWNGTNRICTVKRISNW